MQQRGRCSSSKDEGNYSLMRFDGIHGAVSLYNSPSSIARLVNGLRRVM